MKKNLIIGLVNHTYGTAMEVLLLKDGHRIKRYTPGFLINRKDDYLSYYQDQIEIKRQVGDVFEGVDVVIVESQYHSVFAQAQYLGVPTIGTPPLAKALEDNRVFAKKVARERGLASAPCQKASNLKEAKAAIKKFDGWAVLKAGNAIAEDRNMRTVVPQNEYDLASIIAAIDYFRGGASLIFEKIIKGVEVAFSGYFNGHKFVLPYNVNFEYKPSNNDDRGILTGEVGTVMFHERDTSLKPWRLLKKFEELLQRAGFCGVFDLNCILSPAGKLYLLEFTPRLGWPTAFVMDSAYQESAAEVYLKLASAECYNLPISEDWICSVCGFTYGAPLLSSLDDESDEEKKPFEPRVTGIRKMQRRAGTNIAPLDIRRYKKDRGFYRAGWGDRVLASCGMSHNLNVAKNKAYAAIRNIRFLGMCYRTDIGDRIPSSCALLFKHGYINQQRLDSSVL